MRRLFALCLALGLTTAIACGDDDDSKAAPVGCTPGQSAGCTCPTGQQGAQVCKDDGSGFNACACFEPGGGGSGGSGGDAGASPGEGCERFKDVDVDCVKRGSADKPKAYQCSPTKPAQCDSAVIAGFVCCP